MSTYLPRGYPGSTPPSPMCASNMCVFSVWQEWVRNVPNQSRQGPQSTWESTPSTRPIYLGSQPGRGIVQGTVVPFSCFGSLPRAQLRWGALLCPWVPLGGRGWVVYCVPGWTGFSACQLVQIGPIRRRRRNHKMQPRFY